MKTEHYRIDERPRMDVAKTCFVAMPLPEFYEYGAPKEVRYPPIMSMLGVDHLLAMITVVEDNDIKVTTEQWNWLFESKKLLPKGGQP